MTQERADALPLGEALGHAAAQTSSAVSPVLLLWALGMGASVVRVGLGVAVATALVHGALRALGPSVGAFGVLLLMLGLARTLVLGGALRQGSLRSLGESVEGLGTAMLRAAAHGLTFFWVDLALQLAVVAFQACVGTAGVLGYGFALSHAAHGGVASLTLALAVALALAVGLMTWLLAPVAFVRAILRQEPVTVAIWESAARLARRPGTVAAVLLITGLASVSGSVMASLPDMGSHGSVGPRAIEILVAGMGLASLFVTFVQALVDLFRVHALGALELHHQGRLPSRVRAAPIPVAELVVEALPVGPAPPDGTA